MRSRLQNHINLAKKLTFRKIINSGLVLVSFYVSKFRRKPIQWGLPMSMSVEPTTACNLGCPECPSGLRSFSRPTGNLKTDTFQKILDEAGPTLNYLTFYFQGEPYIHPDLLGMVAAAKRKKIYTSTSTNAHFLGSKNAEATVRSGLDKLIISVDGTTQETYENYRINGKLEKVLEGAQNVVRWKKELKSKTPHIVFQFLVVKQNEHQVEEVKALAKKIGVDDVVLKTAQLYDYKNGNPLMPTNDKYSRYAKQKDGTYTIKNALENHCWRLWHSCVMTWDGKIVPCCFDKDASHPMGDLHGKTFPEIWRGPAYQNFRTMLIKSRSTIDICTNCSEGTTVFS